MDDTPPQPPRADPNLAAVATSLAALAAWLSDHGAALADALRAFTNPPSAGGISAGGGTSAGGGISAGGGGTSLGRGGGAAAEADAAESAVARLREGLGTLQSNAEHALRSTVVGGIHAASEALTQALFHTRHWGEAFVRLGEQVVQTLIEIALKMAVVQGLEASFGVAGFFANGGAVAHFAGGGPAGDDIPAMVSAGEYIVRASAAAQMGPGFLGGLNQGLVDLDRLPPGARVQGAPGEDRWGDGGAGGARAGAAAVHLHVHGDPASALKGALSTTDGQAAVVDLVRRNIRFITA